jgi:SAM-dependent methyltransferase
MVRFLCVIALAAALASPGLAAAETAHQHSFSDAGKWAKVFDDPARDAWQKPREVIAALNLPVDATVADIGAGTGYFAAPLARAASKGRVFAQDVEPGMVKHLGERAAREGLPNLEPILGKAGDPALPAKVDLALIVDTYHHIGDRVAYFQRLRASLKPSGAVAIVDFTPESPYGPHKGARIPASDVEAEMKQAGYALAAKHDFLPYQYFLVFKPI